MHGECSSPYWGEAVVCGHAAGQVCEHLVLCSQVLIPVFCDKKNAFWETSALEWQKGTISSVLLLILLHLFTQLA